MRLIAQWESSPFGVLQLFANRGSLLWRHAGQVASLRRARRILLNDDAPVKCATDKALSYNDWDDERFRVLCDAIAQERWDIVSALRKGHRVQPLRLVAQGVEQ